MATSRLKYTQIQSIIIRNLWRQANGADCGRFGKILWPFGFGGGNVANIERTVDKCERTRLPIGINHWLLVLAPVQNGCCFELDSLIRWTILYGVDGWMATKAQWLPPICACSGQKNRRLTKAASHRTVYYYFIFSELHCRRPLSIHRRLVGYVCVCAHAKWELTDTDCAMNGSEYASNASRVH